MTANAKAFDDDRTVGSGELFAATAMSAKGRLRPALAPTIGDVSKGREAVLLRMPVHSSSAVIRAVAGRLPSRTDSCPLNFEPMLYRRQFHICDHYVLAFFLTQSSFSRRHPASQIYQGCASQLE